MKKYQFIFATIALGADAVLAVLSFIIIFCGFTMNSFTSIDLGALVPFDILFWVAGRMLAPIVRECYDDWQESEKKVEIDV